MSSTNLIGKVKDPIRTLKLIHKVAPNAIIAGGYHRDIFNNVHYSDVDIYVEDSTPDNFDVFYADDWSDLLNLKSNLKSMDRIQELGEDAGYNKDGDISIIYGVIKNEISYNIIVVSENPIDYIMGAFDFNICKTYCDGKKISFTAEFMSDVEHKTITFADRKMSFNEFSHSMSVHLPKIQDKYPHHKLIVPERLKEMYSQYNQMITF